jgi:hypothetical protein
MGSISGSGGGLVCGNQGMIFDSYATGNVFGGGGLVRDNISHFVCEYPATISNCYATGTVTGYKGIHGGLVGNSSVRIHSDGRIGKAPLISNCYATGNCRVSGVVVSDIEVTPTAGGLVGYNRSSGTICKSYALGNVESTYLGGGLVGTNHGKINDCYASGNVSGIDGGEYTTSHLAAVGGLSGYSSDEIVSCYSTGRVTIGEQAPHDLGGLVGKSGGTVSVSFWDVETSGCSSSAGGTGKTTAQMKTRSTFTSAGWDFTDETANGTEDIWRLCVDLTDYPRFVWQKTLLADFICPNGVNGLDLGFFVERWLADDCDQLNDYCEGTDLDKGGEVDGKDYGLFAGYWSAELMVLMLDEDFEAGDFSKYDWQHSGNANWVVVSDIKYEGSYCGQSGTISDNEQSVLEVSVNTGIGSVSFYCKVSSEADEDYLRFYIDDELQDTWSGEQDWSLQEYAITSGPRTLKWSYEKDASMSAGSDCGWIDNITIIGEMP